MTTSLLKTLVRSTGPLAGRPARAGFGQWPWKHVVAAGRTLVVWVRRSNQRRDLRRLLGQEPHFFLDIGIPRATVYNESDKWFWQR